jgi:type IV pilus assembly protein PilQ
MAPARKPSAPLAVLLAIAALGTGAVLSPRAAHARPPGAVDLDVVGADLRDVLRLFADVGHVNLVVADEVTGRVTARLHGVPWRRALDAILVTRGYEAERDGDVLRVAPAATFARERAARLEARAACIAAAPLETRFIPVSYADPFELAALIRPTLTERGSVSVDLRTRTLLVTDVVGCD